MISTAINSTMASNAGRRIAKNAVSADSTSSAVLTTVLPVPAVAAVITGRAADLTTCTVPATSSPQAIASTGCTSAMAFVLAANRTAPATGRIKVWTMSLMLSTTGILSARISMAASTTRTPIVHQLSSASKGSLRRIRSVNRETRETIKSGR